MHAIIFRMAKQLQVRLNDQNTKDVTDAKDWFGVEIKPNKIANLAVEQGIKVLKKKFKGRF